MEKNNLSIPIAIVVAGALIAGGIFFSRGPSTTKDPNGVGVPNTNSIDIKAVTEADHILGNPNADIKIVEYSDTECPFCKNFHVTMHQIMDQYGKDAKVAWVYRHFPLYKGAQPLHSKAGKEAEATECANELGGPTKFWEYIDKVYEITPSNNGLEPVKLLDIAEQVGLNRASFDSCLKSGKYADKISKAYDEALKAGANGTPYNVVVTKDGKKVPISGAQPLSAVKAVIDTLLNAQ